MMKRFTTLLPTAWGNPWPSALLPLLLVLMLWLLPGAAMAQTPMGMGVYDKQTRVLTLMHWVAEKTPSADEELYALYNPDDAPGQWFRRVGAAEGTDHWDWSADTRKAKEVVIEFGYRNYAYVQSTYHKMFYNFANLERIDGMKDLTNVNDNKPARDMSYLFAGCSSIESILFSDFFDSRQVYNMSHMFEDCHALKELDLSKVYTYEVTDMSYMFHNCENLTTIHYGNGLTMTNVEDASYMYAGCKSLSQVELFWNCGIMKDMKYMFSHCEQLKEIDLTPLRDIHWVEDMSWMFEECHNLKKVNMSNLDGSAVKNMLGMFYNCQALESVNLDNFKTCDVTDMSGMFYMCTSLTALDLSSFNTSLVTNMSNLFCGCASLTALDLSSFNTSQVIDMNQMFCGCASLTALDLSSFNTANVKIISFMFGYCTSLRDIYVGDGFSTASVWSDFSEQMFYECQNLPGWEDNRDGLSYAHWRDGGYFQKLVGRAGDKLIGARGDVLTVAQLTLADGDDLEVYEPFTAAELTYTRTMDDRLWQAAYLPFKVTAEELPEGYAAAAINNFHEYAQQDGSCHMELEAQQIADGESIDALTPFILRRTQDGEHPLTLRTKDVELSTKMSRESTCASVERLYTFRGTMQKLATPGSQDTYFIQAGDLVRTTESTPLPAGRWCMTASQRSDSTLTQALPDRITVKVAGDATAISAVSRAVDADTAAIYDLQGRRLKQEPQHGVYIKNGKKYMK